MEENDAQNAASGLSKELLKDIAAQNAIIVSARELINRLAQKTTPKTEQGLHFGGWVYSMADLERWVKLFTKESNNKQQKEEIEKKKTLAEELEDIVAEAPDLYEALANEEEPKQEELL